MISSDPVERFGDAPIAGHWHLADCLDTDALTAAVAEVGDRIGGVDRLLGILENLQVQLGEVRGGSASPASAPTSPTTSATRRG